MADIIQVDSARVRVGNEARLWVNTTALALDEANHSYLAVWDSRGRGDFEPVGKAPLAKVEQNGQEIAVVNLTSQGRAIRWVASQVAAGPVDINVTIYELNPKVARLSAANLAATLTAILSSGSGSLKDDTITLDVIEPSRQVEVSMRRAHVDPDPLQALQTAIRNSGAALGYDRYERFMNGLFGSGARSATGYIGTDRIRLPFPDADAYRQMKVATEVFIAMSVGTNVESNDPRWLAEIDDGFGLAAEERRYDRRINGADEILGYWRRLMKQGADRALDSDDPTLLYLALVRNKIRGIEAVPSGPAQSIDERQPVQTRTGAAMDVQLRIQEKLTFPTFLELIWSYWHEEGMLVQTMNAITWRFQNRRSGAERDPLSMVEIDPLRPLNNFIWGYIQDEQHRLTLVRRAYEYDHHYGLSLSGKALPPVRGADSRTRFLEAFHHLLFLCAIFFKEEDDTTVIADGFPILNALKEVHLLLTQGAHNQYGDLPWTARQEMLMQQWLLARPEFREFLPRRIMVDYPEPWMDSVETMKTLQGWRSASVLHFRDLGVFGEQILLGIRFGAWPSEIESLVAANWARYWRPEIQGYIHAYRAATGVDLTERVDATPPSLLLQQRLQQQLPAGVRGRPIAGPAVVRPVVRQVPRAALPWGKGDR